MIIHSLRFSARCLTLAVLLAAGAHAEPYLAVAQGLKCSQCHVNPTGGGLRNAFGNVFAQTQLPAHRVDTGSDVWAGQLSRYLALGADLRFDAQAQQVPHSKTLEDFQMEQTRLYVSASVIPERLLVYVDEQLAPGGALNREAYGLFWSADHSWYLKGGQMYLPFGLRLQDQTSFVGQVSGINMTTPDEGVEFGWLKGHWDAQLAVSNGTAGGAGTSNGKQSSAQLTWVESLGHNIKVTAEYLDPNRRVAHDAQTRWSLLYELTPVQFVQLRAGVRYSDGIPQLASEHTRLYFLELHGFF